MKILQTLPSKINGRKIEIYQFASAYYARLVDDAGFTFDDSIHMARSTGGTYQSALEFAYRYQHLSI